jgi:alkanesulfonate monooxygenase SsuD/methylene tetrahydromethanopterin reductase-like flavin-dependent oxidoreductase (luciferase family)
MRYRICAASIGEYAEPGRVVEVAEAAEAAGWEALLTWDHLAYVWAGWRRFTAFGEPDGAGDRAAMLDEGLEVVTALWSGQPVRHAGRFYQVDGVTRVPGHSTSGSIRPVRYPSGRDVRGCAKMARRSGLADEQRYTCCGRHCD